MITFLWTRGLTTSLIKLPLFCYHLIYCQFSCEPLVYGVWSLKLVPTIENQGTIESQ